MSSPNASRQSSRPQATKLTAQTPNASKAHPPQHVAAVGTPRDNSSRAQQQASTISFRLPENDGGVSSSPRFAPYAPPTSAFKASEPDGGNVVVDDDGLLPQLHPETYWMRLEEQRRIVLSGESKSPRDVILALAPKHPISIETAARPAEQPAPCPPVQPVVALPEVDAAGKPRRQRPAGAVVFTSESGMFDDIPVVATPKRPARENPAAASPNASGVEARLFRGAPPHILTKLHKFVSAKGGPDSSGSWDLLSELIDSYIGSAAYADAITSAAQTIANESSQFPQSVARAIAQQQSMDPKMNTAALDASMNPRTLLTRWDRSIHATVSMAVNLLAIATHFCPRLADAADIVRHTLITSIYPGSKNVAHRVLLPSTIEEVRQSSTYEELSYVFEKQCLPVFATEEWKSETKDMVLPTEKVHKGSAKCASMLSWNLGRWRAFGMRAVFCAWRQVRHRRLADEDAAKELLKMRSEVDYLMQTKKLQQQELSKLHAERQQANDQLIREHHEVELELQKKISSLQTQVENLIQLVKSTKAELGHVRETNAAEATKAAQLIAQKENSTQSLIKLLRNRDMELVESQKKITETKKCFLSANTCITSIMTNAAINLFIDRGILGKLAAGAGSAGSAMGPLAGWLTETASKTMLHPDMKVALGKRTVTSSSDHGAQSTNDDEGSPRQSNRRGSLIGGSQSLPRIRDFTEGSPVLDSYAAACYHLDPLLFKLDAVCAVIFETDLAFKADMVVELLRRLFRTSTKLHVTDGMFRDPMDVVTAQDLASTTNFRPHLLVTSSLITFWLSSMTEFSVQQVAHPWNPDLGDAPPFAEITPLGANYDNLLGSKMEMVMTLFSSWKSAVLSIPCTLLDVVLDTSPTPATPTAGTTMLLSPPLHGTAGGGGRRSSFKAVKSVEERLVTGQLMTRLLAQDFLKAVFQKAAAETWAASSKQQQAMVPQQQVSDEAVADAADEFISMAERQAVLICGIFKYYGSLTAGQEGGPSLALTVLDLVRFWQDTCAAFSDASSGKGGNSSDAVQLNVQMISREDLREMTSQIVQSRRRVAAKKLAASGKAPDDEAANTAVVPDKQQQLAVEDLAVFLLRMSHRLFGSNVDAQAAALFATAGGGRSAIPMTICQALEAFNKFVSDVLPMVLACDTSLLRSVISSDQATRRVVEDSKPLMIAVFQQVCANDAKLSSKNVISQAAFVAVITDMKAMEEDGGLGTTTSSSKALSIASIQTVFIHALQLDLNKPMLMCPSEFVSALVSIALLRIPSSTVRPSAKVARFVGTILEPFVKRKPEILARYNSAMSAQAAASQAAAQTAASLAQPAASAPTSATMAAAAATAAAAFGSPLTTPGEGASSSGPGGPGQASESVASSFANSVKD